MGAEARVIEPLIEKPGRKIAPDEPAIAGCMSAGFPKMISAIIRRSMVASRCPS
jgi:hypothetical protein